ncbi:MAG: pyridoxal phosphate-dependent aminotransferase [Holophaga sp.]|nr:pyridoxal phosphate-dependent aminotransferase [Holophaga sp.]
MNHQIARVVQNLRASVIREISLRAADLDNVIMLGIGEPDFHTPGQICQEALRDALGGATHYTPSQGDKELLGALVQSVNAQHDLGITEQNLVVTLGGMGALVAYFRTVLDEGDEVLVPDPYFPSYRPHIELVGGRLVPVPTRFEERFVVSPEAIAAAITPRTKVLLLNSPNNPTGAVIPAATLDAIADLVRDRDLLVVSDEVYDRLVFDGRRHESIITRPGMPDRTVVINSFSKSYAMTGWRIGYAYGPAWILEAMTRVVSHCTSCTPSVSQRAALAALRMDPAVVDDMMRQFASRSRFLYEGLSSIKGFRVNKPEGSFYLFPDISQLTDDPYRFVLDLLQEERVGVVPGFPFGLAGKNCVRFACTVDQDMLAEALQRIERFVVRRAEQTVVAS